MISVIIPNYNGARFLKDCLNSIREQSYRDFEVIIVDNASKDESLDILKSDYPKTKVVLNKSNLGFVGANNEGYKQAQGEYVLFLNNDIKLDKDCFKYLLEKIEANKKEIGVVFSKILRMDQPKIYDAVGSYLTSFGFLYHLGFREIDKGQYDNLENIFSPKGVCFLVPKKIIDEVGLFDSDYFAYFEESDFFWRVWLNSYKIAYAPKAIVYHKVGGTSTQLSSPFIDYHSFKNRIASLIKNLSFFSTLYMLPLHIFCCLVISLLYVFMLRFKNSKAVLGAIGWNIRHLPQTLNKRKDVQGKIRKISDKELFKSIKKDMPIMKLIKFVGIYLKRW
jgi:hypothetical protein